MAQGVKHPSLTNWFAPRSTVAGRQQQVLAISLVSRHAHALRTLHAMSCTSKVWREGTAPIITTLSEVAGAQSPTPATIPFAAELAFEFARSSLAKHAGSGNEFRTYVPDYLAQSHDKYEALEKVALHLKGFSLDQWHALLDSLDIPALKLNLRATACNAGRDNFSTEQDYWKELARLDDRASWDCVIASDPDGIPVWQDKLLEAMLPKSGPNLAAFEALAPALASQVLISWLPQIKADEATDFVLRELISRPKEIPVHFLAEFAAGLKKATSSHNLQRVNDLLKFSSNHLWPFVQLHRHQPDQLKAILKRAEYVKCQTRILKANGAALFLGNLQRAFSVEEWKALTQ